MLNAKSPLTPPREILIVKPSSLGDVVHTLPSAVLLRRAFPEAKIRWLVNTEWMPLLAGLTQIDEVIEFPRRNFRGIGGLLRIGPWARALRERVNADLVLDYQGLLRSALISKLCRGKSARVLGLSDAREGARFFYDEAVDVSGCAHAVDRYLALTRRVTGAAGEVSLEWPLPEGKMPPGFDDAGTDATLVGQCDGPGGPSEISRWSQPPDPRKYGPAPAGALEPDEQSDSAAPPAQIATSLESGGLRHRLISEEASGLDDPPNTGVSQRHPCRRDYVLLHPFSRGAGKSLTVEQVTEFCAALAPQSVVIAGRADVSLPAIPNATDLLNRTDLHELIWLLRRARFVVSVDSGPMHMAAGVTSRLVSIHTWSDPAKVGPYRPEAWIWQDGRLFQQKDRTKFAAHRQAANISSLAEFVKTQLCDAPPLS